MGLQPIIVRVLDDVREIDALSCEHLRIKNLGAIRNTNYGIYCPGRPYLKVLGD